MVVVMKKAFVWVEPVCLLWRLALGRHLNYEASSRLLAFTLMVTHLSGIQTMKTKCFVEKLNHWWQNVSQKLVSDDDMEGQIAVILAFQRLMSYKKFFVDADERTHTIITHNILSNTLDLLELQNLLINFCQRSVFATFTTLWLRLIHKTFIYSWLE